MEDAGGLVLLQTLHGVSVGFPVVDDDRQSEVFGQCQLTAEEVHLGVPRGVLFPVVVEADLTDGDRFVLFFEEFGNHVQIALALFPGLFRMDAQSRVDVVVLVGQVQDADGAQEVDGAVHDADDTAFGQRGAEDFSAVFVEGLVVVVGVGVKDVRQHGESLFLKV